jgi:hypothetical protein
LRRRTVCLVLVALFAGCGGGGPKTDAAAVAQVLKDATKAVADGDGGKACGFLTPQAQQQAQLQVGTGVLGQADCPTLVGRATAFMTPIEKKQIEKLEPSNVQVNGASASATLATPAIAAGASPISVQLNLQKVGSDWKISGFVNAVGVPGT